jgi:hypothetical protein
VAIPQLKTYFKKQTSDQFGQIELTGIIGIKSLLALKGM